MRSRQEIKRQLEHFKSGKCQTPADVTQHWIAALEWVLMIEHEAIYDKFVKALEDHATDARPNESIFERTGRLFLGVAVERLK